MKTRITIVVFFLCTATKGFAQIDLLPVRLAGVVYANDITHITPFVEVINLRTGRGVLSDSIGFFRISLFKTDTLLIRCIGFENKFFTLPDSITSTVLFVEIRLTETTYLLDVVDIIALSRLNQFKHDFVNIPLLDDPWQNYYIIIPGVNKQTYKWKHDNVDFDPKKGLNGPASILYYLWSDEGKSLRKYAEIINNEESNRLIDEKFNMKLLSDFTGFTGDTLIDFKLYLNFSQSYLLTKSGYEIFLNVQNQLPAFKKTYFKTNE